MATMPLTWYSDVLITNPIYDFLCSHSLISPVIAGWFSSDIAPFAEAPYNAWKITRPSIPTVTALAIFQRNCGKVPDVIEVHPEIARHEVRRQEYDRDYREHQNGFTVDLKPNIDELYRSVDKCAGVVPEIL